MDKELMCAICLEFFDTPLMLPCSHNFCKKCLAGIISSREQYSYRSRSFDCPLCQRKTVLERPGTESFPVNLSLENVIHAYKSEADVSFNDASWTRDVNDTAGPCQLHKEALEFYCLSCNQAVCKKCNCNDKEGATHRVFPIKEQMHRCQTNILKCLSEVKKKCTSLTDRIQLLGDISAGVDENEKYIEARLDEEVESLISKLKSQKEELKRQLHNDMLEIKLPIEDQKRKHQALNSTVLDHQRKLSLVKGTRDPSLRIKLLQESERQMNSLLCFDLAWFSAHKMPTINMPTWTLDKQTLEQAICNLSWKKTGVIEQSIGWSRGSSPGIDSITIPTSTLTKLDIKDDKTDVAKYFDKEKKSHGGHPSLFFWKSIDEAPKSTNGFPTERRSLVRGASEPPTTHRSSVSIQRRQHPGQGNLSQGQVSRSQSSRLENQGQGDNLTQNGSSSRNVPVHFVSSISSQPLQSQQSNFNIRLPHRSDFDIPTNIVPTSSTAISSAPRFSLPGSTNGMTIQLRRNSESGLQALHNTDSSNTSVTSPTLPITTPITTSLLANLPSGSNVPSSTPSALSTNEAGAASAPVSMETGLVNERLVAPTASGNPTDSISQSQSGESSFSDANLPVITSRDFSPSRGGNPAVAGRRTCRPRRVLKKWNS
ncbi:hypothetical protein FSP39_000201 [Pinctada imbricata]|uniref:Uncharacterized protein n=1 Tax=Pinctada imbricata TaxID=66713 RepID=A0AA88YBZ3_PINIB|nr:hypothetical protein FSP39_000201 [Pinctada imbricata]